MISPNWLLAFVMLVMLWHNLMHQAHAYHGSIQSCGNNGNDQWLSTGGNPLTVYDDTCEGGNCACLCTLGFTGQVQSIMVLDTVRANTYRYPQDFPYHCEAKISRDLCSSHGNAIVPQRYRDYDLPDIRCLCDAGWLGFVHSPTWIYQQCHLNINAVICSGHGTYAASGPLIATTPYSSINCVCASDYQTIPQGVGNWEGYKCSQKKPCPLANQLPCPPTGPCPQIPCGSNGVCGASQPTCTCNTGFGGTTCCPRSPATLTGAICGGRGTCGSVGQCVCNAGFGGTYCCPKLSTQTKECGAHGTCTAAGTCSCQSGWAGTSCSVNVQCPSNDLITPVECSGGGACVTEAGPEGLIAAMRFVDDASPAATITISGVPFTDEGAVNLVQRFLTSFLNYTASQSNTFILANQNFVKMCLQAANKPRDTVCWALLLEQFAELLSTLPGGYSTPAVYVTAVLQRQFPSFSSFDSAFVVAVAADISTSGLTSPALTKRKRAIGSIMAYLLLRNPVTGAISYPSFPRTVCKCSDASASAIVGVTRAGSGTNCAKICFVGNDRQVCSGFKQGVFRGACDGASQQCVCGSKFEGNACQVSLSGRCFPPGSISDDLCTHASHGSCISFTDPFTQVLDRRCDCDTFGTWEGEFCEFSKCTPDNLSDSARRTECNNRGHCQTNGNCNCDVVGQLSLSDLLASPPFLPVGQYCQTNAITQCGVSTNIGGGKVRWSMCNSRGFCNSTLQCECDEGFSGNKCQFTACAEACGLNAKCNSISGLCECKPLWSTPSGCVLDACQCSAHSCGFGEPVQSPTGLGGALVTSCSCDANYVKDNLGKCTVLQCPLVVLTNQGERPCTTADTRCPSIVNTAQTRANSLASGCCYDACGAGCRRNATSNSVNCICSPSIAYTESAGICYSKCHGQPFQQIGQSVTCNCDGLEDDLLAEQFMDATCLIETCSNGGVSNGAGGCTCKTVFAGPYCDTELCTFRGSAAGNGLSCVCAEPFKAASVSDKFCSADQCLGGAYELMNETDPNPYRCLCNTDTLYGSRNLSCVALNCASGSQSARCNACLHGSTSYIEQNRIKCDCSQTTYTGQFCQTLTCDHGGHPLASNTVCHCPYPFIGQRCESFNCGFGHPATMDPGLDTNTTCVCEPGFSDTDRNHPCNIFDLASSSSASELLEQRAELTGIHISSSSSSSSSGFTNTSSSTASSSSSSTAVAVVVTESKAALSGGAIAGIVVGGVVVAGIAGYVILSGAGAAAGAAGAGATVSSQGVEMATVGGAGGFQGKARDFKRMQRKTVSKQSHNKTIGRDQRKLERSQYAPVLTQ